MTVASGLPASLPFVLRLFSLSFSLSLLFSLVVVPYNRKKTPPQKEGLYVLRRECAASNGDRSRTEQWCEGFVCISYTSTCVPHHCYNGLHACILQRYTRHVEVSRFYMRLYLSLFVVHCLYTMILKCLYLS